MARTAYEKKIRAAVKFAKANGWRIVKSQSFARHNGRYCMCPLAALALKDMPPGLRKSFMIKNDDDFEALNGWVSARAAKVLGIGQRSASCFMNGFDGGKGPTRSPSEIDMVLYDLGVELRKELRPRAVEV